MKNNQDDKLYSEMYNNGEEYFRENKIRLSPAISNKSTSLLEIRVEKKLNPLPGFNPPDGVFIHRVISKKDWKDLENLYMDWDTNEDNLMFWRTLFKPTSTKSPLEIYVAQTLQLESEKIKSEGVESLEQNIKIPSFAANRDEDLVKSVVPEKSWFTPEVNQLEIKDLLTLFPEPEQELLALCFGRFLIGASKSVPVGSNKPLDHNWRLFPILYGKEPGQGKSILCGYLLGAMQHLGYLVTNFKSLNKKFNMARIVSSAVTYRDDFTSKALELTLSADDAKPIITGATIEVEEKQQNAIEVPCVCGIIGNVNKFDPRLKFSLDSGMMDRIRYITTLSNLELQELTKSVTGLSAGTPSLKTYDHWKYLAEKLNVPTKTLALKLLSLCFEKFWQHYQNNTLETRVRYLSTRLRTKVDSDLGQNFATSLIFSILLNKSNGLESNLKSINDILLTPISLEQGLANFSRLLIDPKFHPIKCLIRKHWIEQERPAIHPWVAFEKISPLAAAKSYTNLVDAKISLGSLQTENPAVFTKLLDLPHALEVAYKNLYTNEGYPLGSGISYVQDDWTTSTGSINSIKKLVAYVIENLETDKQFLFQEKALTFKVFKELLKLNDAKQC